MSLQVGQILSRPAIDLSKAPTAAKVKAIAQGESVLEVDTVFTKYVNVDGINERDKNGNILVEYSEIRKGEVQMPIVEAEKLSLKI